MWTLQLNWMLIPAENTLPVQYEIPAEILWKILMPKCSVIPVGFHKIDFLLCLTPAEISFQDFLKNFSNRFGLNLEHIFSEIYLDLDWIDTLLLVEFQNLPWRVVDFKWIFFLANSEWSHLIISQQLCSWLLPKLPTQERGRMKPGIPLLPDWWGVRQESSLLPVCKQLGNNWFSIDWSGFTLARQQKNFASRKECSFLAHTFLALSCIYISCLVFDNYFRSSKMAP